MRNGKCMREPSKRRARVAPASKRRYVSAAAIYKYRYKKFLSGAVRATTKDLYRRLPPGNIKTEMWNVREGGYRAPSHSIKRNNRALMIYEDITGDPRTRFGSTYYTNILDLTRPNATVIYMQSLLHVLRRKFVLHAAKSRD